MTPAVLPDIPLTGSAFEGYLIPVAVSIAIILFAGSKFMEKYAPLREVSVREATKRRDKAEKALAEERKKTAELEGGHSEEIRRLREELTKRIDALQEELREQGRLATERSQELEQEHREELAAQEERHREEVRLIAERHARAMTEREQRIMRLIADKFTLETFITSKGGKLPEGLMADPSGLPLPGTPIR